MGCKQQRPDKNTEQKLLLSDTINPLHAEYSLIDEQNTLAFSIIFQHWGGTDKNTEQKLLLSDTINPFWIFFNRRTKYIGIFYYLSTLRWHRQLNFFLIEKQAALCFLHKYHACWQPGNVRSQNIGSHVIDLVSLVYSCVSTTRVKWHH